MKNELVSILLPTYNSQKYLEQCLKSIVNQSYKNIELIIVDNKSTDNTLKIIDTFSQKLNIFVYQYEANNLSKALNYGISKSNGIYIARLDSDDIINKHRIIKQVKSLINNNELIFIGTNALRFFNFLYVCKPFNLFYTNTDLKLNLLFQSSFIHPSIMFNKNNLKRVGKYVYNEKMNECEDYELWSRLIDKSSFKNLSYYGIFYRVHQNSASIKKKDKLNSYFTEVNKKLLNEYNINLTDEQYNYHLKITQLNINSDDDFDILNSFYKNFLSKIKNNSILKKKYKESDIHNFISKKYFRFCIRSTLSNNFKLSTCIDKNIPLSSFNLFILMILNILKIKI